MHLRMSLLLLANLAVVLFFNLQLRVLKPLLASCRNDQAHALEERGGTVVDEEDVDEWSDDDEDPHAAGKQKTNLKEALLDK